MCYSTGLTLKARHEISQTQKDKVLHDPALHEVSSVVKWIDTESNWWWAGAGDGSGGGLMDKALPVRTRQGSAMSGGDGCTAAKGTACHWTARSARAKRCTPPTHVFHHQKTTKEMNAVAHSSCSRQTGLELQGPWTPEWRPRPSINWTLFPDQRAKGLFLTVLKGPRT